MITAENSISFNFFVCFIFLTSQSDTENPRYNDSVCYQRVCCKIEFAVIKNFDMGPSKARITDTFEHFYDSYVLYIFRIGSARRF